MTKLDSRDYVAQIMELRQRLAMTERRLLDECTIAQDLEKREALWRELLVLHEAEFASERELELRRLLGLDT